MTTGKDADVVDGIGRFLLRRLPGGRRAWWGIAACALLIVGPALLVALPVPVRSDSPCEVVQRWASQQFAGRTPALDEVVRFDRLQRIAIFDAVSPDARASLWRERLQRASRRPDFSAAQRALIAEGLALTTPALYRRDPAATQAFDRFWARAQPAFLAPAQRKIWSELGELPAAPAVRGAGLFDTLTQPFRASATGGSCYCASDDIPSHCPSGNQCVYGGCAPTQSGCGDMYRNSCFGICVPLERQSNAHAQ